MEPRKPLLAITQGDPAGVGPETVVGAWRQPEMHDLCRVVAIGHPIVFQRAVELVHAGATIVTVESPDEIDSSPSVIPCLSSGSDDAADVLPATIDPRGGQAAYDALVVAAHLALDGKVSGLVTAPLHKAALWRAGHHFPGHTELLAQLCGVDDFAMMLYLGPTAMSIDGSRCVRGSAGLGVVHVTLHMGLAEVFRHLTTESILAKIHLADQVMGKIKGEKPRIGVCALNPHAGEEGLFGNEEIRTIAPAVEAAQHAGLLAVGPFPTDTLMVRARNGEFDAVVAMYHDQGHIALKLLGMHQAVNVTCGLPIVRTSVAHGTAFDLAWQGRAETSGMIEAVRMAAKLSKSISGISDKQEKMLLRDRLGC
ncbi:MAG: 4-hydroxythreonine-4-phosphate dehydrogenase PdxA [Pirellulales bacterium]|nr:4-hydroxythreonine-4-phosphate dehydrogenase PdxA [Pirellulales bacterium]